MKGTENGRYVNSQSALIQPIVYRDLIIVTAFAVVLGTLVVQGLTIGPLLGVMDLHDDRLVEREVLSARERALQAAFATFDGDTSDSARLVESDRSHQRRRVPSPRGGVRLDRDGHYTARR